MKNNMRDAGLCLAAALGGVLLLPGEAVGQRVFTVGRSGDTETLQSVIHRAASGDVILVTPGEYDPFVLEGKSLTVAVDGIGDVLIRADGTRPAIEVRGAGPTDTVVLHGLRVLWDGVEARIPAVWVHGNTGGVHLRDLWVRCEDPADHARVHAPVYVSNNGGRVWCTKVVINGPAAQSGSTRSRYRPGSRDDGLAGLFVDDSEVILNRAWIHGFNARQPGVGHAGAAVRVAGSGRLRLRSDGTGLGLSLFGGHDGAVGGDVVQLVRPDGAGIDLCGRATRVRGRGAQVRGGYFALEDDHGIAQIAGGGSHVRELPGCVAESYGSLEITSLRPVPGDIVWMRVRSPEPRDYVLLASLRLASGPGDVAGIAGQLMVDLNQAFHVDSGQIGAAPHHTVTRTVPVPGDASVRGLMLAFQPVFLPTGMRDDFLLGAGDFLIVGH